MRVYLSPKVLIVDEFGVWPYDRTAAMLLFALVSARYERGSMLLTSNKGFAEWGDVLGDPVVATAILDRLLHHSHILNTRGESYRLKEKKRAGLFGRISLPTAAGRPDDESTKEVGQSCRQFRVNSNPALTTDSKDPATSLVLFLSLALGYGHVVIPDRGG
jgi:hypothetical protein